MPRAVHHRIRTGHPTLLRSDHEVQVGVGSAAVVLRTTSGGASGLLGLLALLDGQRSLVVAARAAGVPIELAQQAVRALDRAGVLERPGAALTGRTIKIIGAGRLGSRLTELLLREDPELLLVADTDPADPAIHRGARPGSSNADALAARLRTESVRTVVHWTKPDGPPPDLTVVATDAPECDRMVTDTLIREDAPHLLLRGQGDGVLVGPFVQPGHGGCVRCGDLHRRDRDPAWPVVLDQLSRLRGSPTALAVDWGAASAAAQVLAWATGRRPEVWSATLELSGRDWTTRLRTWPAHARCGCAGLGPG